MKAGRRHYTVKTLIDTSSNVNIISKSLTDKLGEKYGKHQKYKKAKNSLGTIWCLDLSFYYNGKDRLVGSSDKILNDFEDGIRIYSDFVPFCKYLPKLKTSFSSNSESEIDDPELKKKIKKLERTIN
ncbi:hypothetical protein RhiirA5_415362 [Rhizophagus irregularis]|uniref:Uncharacterized protein n=1 Tax=Rhizophagus irregularis TaxID=588596 RepID=A0A2N0PS39_9GLOM|nr:hypothetical protein RhiirA5_415362 [Rhizophagus irregularis]